MRPFMFLAFPPWFGKTYPELLKRVQANSDRLTTHFDVHSTLLDVLYLRHDDPHRAQRKAGHGISLFDEVKKNFRWLPPSPHPLPFLVSFGFPRQFKGAARSSDPELGLKPIVQKRVGTLRRGTVYTFRKCSWTLCSLCTPQYHREFSE